MKIQEAIKKAEEAGWQHDGSKPYAWAYIVLDPLFWQSLGKAMGWDGKTYYQLGSKFSELLPDWKAQMHRFIDHLAEGNTAESFFEMLT